MKILFICTHNRCRSIACEAVTNHLDQGRITACSAGSEPAFNALIYTLEARIRQVLALPAGLHPAELQQSLAAMAEEG